MRLFSADHGSSGLLWNHNRKEDFNDCFVPLLSVEVKALVVHALGHVEITLIVY